MIKPQYSPTLYEIKSDLEREHSPLTLDNLRRLSTQLSVHSHVAVLHEPYLSKILQGKKRIESRFTKVRTPPFQHVDSHDIVFLKLVAGPIIGIAEVSVVQNWGPCEPGFATDIMKKYWDELALEDSFADSKVNSVYVTLISFANVLSIKPISLLKADRRAWVVLNEFAQRTLL